MASEEEISLTFPRGKIGSYACAITLAFVKLEQQQVDPYLISLLGDLVDRFHEASEYVYREYLDEQLKRGSDGISLESVFFDRVITDFPLYTPKEEE